MQMENLSNDEKDIYVINGSFIKKYLLNMY